MLHRVLHCCVYLAGVSHLITISTLVTWFFSSKMHCASLIIQTLSVRLCVRLCVCVGVDVGVCCCAELSLAFPHCCSDALHVSMQGVGWRRCHFICKSAPSPMRNSSSSAHQHLAGSKLVLLGCHGNQIRVPPLVLSLSLSRISHSFSSVGKLHCSGDRVKDAGIPPHKPLVV